MNSPKNSGKYESLVEYFKDMDTLFLNIDKVKQLLIFLPCFLFLILNLMNSGLR